jgi:hypothetical protein
MLLSRAQAMCEEVGITVPAWVHDVEDEAMSMARVQVDETAFADAWGQGRTLTVDEAVALAVDALD